MVDLLAGITALSEGIGIAKALRGISKDYDSATHRAQVAEMLDLLTDAKLAMAEAKETLAERDKEIARLKASFEAKADLVKADGDYEYFADENGNPVGYPTCPKCQPLHGRIVQLKQKVYVETASCPACSEVFAPVTCFLPQGSSYRTAKEREKAEHDAAYAAVISDNRASYY